MFSLIPNFYCMNIMRRRVKGFVAILCLPNTVEEIVKIDTYGFYEYVHTYYVLEGYVMFMPFHLVQFVYELIAYA